MRKEEKPVGGGGGLASLGHQRVKCYYNSLEKVEKMFEEETFEEGPLAGRSLRIPPPPPPRAS